MKNIGNPGRGMKSEAEEKILGNGRRPRVNLDFKGLVRYKGYIYIKHIKRSSLDPEKDSISTSSDAYDDPRTNSVHYFSINSQHLGDGQFQSAGSNDPFLRSSFRFTCKSGTKFRVVLKCHSAHSRAEETSTRLDSFRFVPRIDKL